MDTLNEGLAADAPTPTFTLEKRRARVAVVNKTSELLVAVSVVHKYSEVYRNRREWAAILPGQNTDEEMTVDYHTGALTTGADWWFIAWYSQDLKTKWYSNPANFRGILDKLGSISPQAIRVSAEAIADLLNGKNSGPGADISRELAKATTDPVFNSESSNGFKQHILRSVDDNQLTRIVINANHTITLESPSGISETVVSRLDVG